MTDRHTAQREAEIKPEADREPEFDADVIKDLDAPAEHSDQVRGGFLRTAGAGTQC